MCSFWRLCMTRWWNVSVLTSRSKAASPWPQHAILKTSRKYALGLLEHLHGERVLY